MKTCLPDDRPLSPSGSGNDPAILFINNGWYLPALSGGDVHVMEVAARWAQVQRVGIAMPGWAYRLHASRLNGVRLFETGWLEKSPPKSLAGICVRYLVRSLRQPRVRPDLVVAASQYPYDLIPAVLMTRSRGIPLMVYVFHLPSMFRRGGLRAGLVARWERLAIRFLRLATLVMVDNGEVRRELVGRGIPEERIHPTWNATGPAQSGSVEERRQDEVVFVGRISDTKGWQDLLVVGERLREACPGTRLRVLGEGERKKQLERAIAERGLGDTIQTEGFVDEETKWRALRRAAAFVTPSREEGWGIAVSEALQAGAQVVCYDLPVYREVHGDGRLNVVPMRNVEALAQQVVDVLHGHGCTSPQTPSTSPKTWDDIAWREFGVAVAWPQRPEDGYGNHVRFSASVGRRSHKEEQR